jgi:sugar phosphate isomerase/epimerase
MKNDLKQNILQNLCLSSYAFRYSTAIKDSEKKMTVSGFMHRAADMGFKSVLLCENVRKVVMSRGDICKISAIAQERGLEVELGINGLSREKLWRDIATATQLNSKSIRLVIGEEFLDTNSSESSQISAVLNELDGIDDELRSTGIRLGIENHFDFSTKALVNIVGNFRKENVGFIFDTINCLGLVERPEEAMALMNGRIFSVHLKDYTIVKRFKVEYVIHGTAIGCGKLDVSGILSTLIDQNPGMIVVLELSIPRPNHTMSIPEILSWEEYLVCENYDRLKKIIEEL